ncbi:indole-3-glycerol phosphate synthase TrpC [Limnochorda pilosa]|uniref:Indole-3-glycerol phosphate synthase n=1 Tax=Limnochorda pilosa TaxID=1555112 RepID=A0A0K2SKN5_LIMPI|nr:indole-3-glycerol phosphate synthase TrpC [Limnochorda pilosa]BAS27587.1 indole-3-glycerol-phosphate synthase [Limnochorda pilosa]
MSFLEQIRREKAQEVVRWQARLPMGRMEALARRSPAPRSLEGALRAAGVPAVIAELKQASPSTGWIRRQADPAALARRYQRAGAAALSVLTDRRHFRGSLARLRAVRAATTLPVLRKDFHLEPYQLVQARAAGADAVLVIVALLSDAALGELLAVTRRLGMEALVEVHREEELGRALAAGARLLGVNNRDLDRLETSLEAGARLLPQVPAPCLAVAESGLRTPADVAAMVRAGARAVLVGEALSRSGEPESLLAAFREVGKDAGEALRAQAGG